MFQGRGRRTFNRSFCSYLLQTSPFPAARFTPQTSIVYIPGHVSEVMLLCWDVATLNLRSLSCSRLFTRQTATRNVVDASNIYVGNSMAIACDVNLWCDFCILRRSRTHVNVRVGGSKRVACARADADGFAQRRG